MDLVITSNVLLDFADNTKYAQIVAKQGDTASRKVRVTLKNAGENVVLASSDLAKLNCLKPDGKRIAVTTFEIDNNGEIIFTIPQNALSIHGTVICDITIYETNGSNEILKQITTPSFYIKVEQAV